MFFFFFPQLFWKEVVESEKDALTAEAVEGTTLSFQGVHDVHSCDGLPFRVLGVSYGVPYHVLEEHLQDTSRLFVYQSGYPLDAASPRQTSNGRFRDALDVVSQNFSVTLGASFPQTLSTFSSACHDASRILIRLYQDRRRTTHVTVQRKAKCEAERCKPVPIYTGRGPLPFLSLPTIQRSSAVV